MLFIDCIPILIHLPLRSNKTELEIVYESKE